MPEYYMFNKPQGCVSTKYDRINRTVMDYFSNDIRMRCHIVGRLDKDTEGLLIITDDGKFTDYLMCPENYIKKIYEFFALGYIDEDKIRTLEEGVLLNGSDELTLKSKLSDICILNSMDLLSIVNDDIAKSIEKNPNGRAFYGKICIKEGKKRQIKRMMKAVGSKIVYLKRLSIGTIILDENLAVGTYRRLSDEELLNIGYKR